MAFFPATDSWSVEPLRGTDRTRWTAKWSSHVENSSSPGKPGVCDHFTIKLSGQRRERHGEGPQGTIWEHFHLTWGTWVGGEWALEVLRLWLWPQLYSYNESELWQVIFPLSFSFLTYRMETVPLPQGVAMRIAWNQARELLHCRPLIKGAWGQSLSPSLASILWAEEENGIWKTKQAHLLWLLGIKFLFIWQI